MPAAYLSVSNEHFKFPAPLGGRYPRTRSSQFSIQKDYVEKIENFVKNVDVLEGILNRVNQDNFDDDDAFHVFMKQQAGRLVGLNEFKLGFFLPMAALGKSLIKKGSLKCADKIRPAEGLGSHTALLDAGFKPHQFSHAMKNLCGVLHFQRRETIGENLPCEGTRAKIVYDVFYRGQALHHLFLLAGGEYCSRKKLHGEYVWVDTNEYEPGP